MIISKTRDLSAVEQGQLAAMIESAGYMSLIETLTSMALADAHGANDLSISHSKRVRIMALADQLASIEFGQ